MPVRQYLDETVVPVLRQGQGLTLAHFLARRKHILCGTLGA